jgi:hypothetical protein
MPAQNDMTRNTCNWTSGPHGCASFALKRSVDPLVRNMPIFLGLAMVYSLHYNCIWNCDPVELSRYNDYATVWTTEVGFSSRQEQVICPVIEVSSF